MRVHYEIKSNTSTLDISFDFDFDSVEDMESFEKDLWNSIHQVGVFSVNVGDSRVFLPANILQNSVVTRTVKSS